jgi:hypothetical protein
VTLEDLAARHSRLCWDLSKNEAIAPKFSRDLLRMLEIIPASEIESIWHEHRKCDSPLSYTETIGKIRNLIQSNAHLLVDSNYNTDPTFVCPRCSSNSSFQLASPSQIIPILGYC